MGEGREGGGGPMKRRSERTNRKSVWFHRKVGSSSGKKGRGREKRTENIQDCATDEAKQNQVGWGKVQRGKQTRKLS